MPRAGAGSGGHSSGGGHSFGVSSGGHSIGGRAGGGRSGGSRPGGSFGGGGYRGPRRSYHSWGPRNTVIINNGGSGGSSSGGSGGSGGLTTVIALIFVVVVLAFLIFGGSSSSKVKSTIERTKLETSDAYMNDCIIDEIGWFENISKTEKKLQTFYDKTGVQPYIILRDYDATLTTKKAKEEWAKKYYEEHFKQQNIFLYVYFAERNVDGNVGYMAYAAGTQTTSVMDSEAIEIFWNYLDRYWTGNGTTDEVFIDTFTKTGNTIMHVSTTGKDIIKWLLIVVAIALVVYFVIRTIKMKNQRAKEKAEEDQRILNTPMEDIVDSHADKLAEKYLKDEEK